MTDPEEDRIFLSPEDISELLEKANLGDLDVRRQIAGAIRGVEPRGPALTRLEEAILRMEAPEALGAALMLLRHLGRPGGDVLLRLAVRGPRAQIRIAVLDILGETAPGHSCFVIAPSWKDYHSDVRRVALEALRDSDGGVREAALMALFHLPGEVRRFAEAVLGTLADPDAAVRAAGLRLMRRDVASNDTLVEKVAPLLHDPDAGVRLQAAAFLAQNRVNGEAVIPILTDLLRSPDSEWREDAARALARYGNSAAAAVPVLGEILETARGGELKACLEAVEGIGDAAAPLIPRLSDLASSDDGIDAIFSALSRLGKASVPSLIQLLDGPLEDRRYRAAHALKLMGPDASMAIPTLLRRLADPVARVRFRVAQALLLVDPTSVARLADFVMSRDEFDRGHLLHYLAEEKAPALPLLKDLVGRLPVEMQAIANRHIVRIQNG